VLIVVGKPCYILGFGKKMWYNIQLRIRVMKPLFSFKKRKALGDKKNCTLSKFLRRNLYLLPSQGRILEEELGED